MLASPPTLRVALPLALVSLAAPSSAQTWTPSSLDPAIWYGAANEINASGQVVGKASFVMGAGYEPVAWNGGSSVKLGLYPGDEFGEATGINDAGLIVGTSHVIHGSGLGAVEEVHPMVWPVIGSGGVGTDLNTMVTGGDPFFSLESCIDVNNAGQILGEGRPAANPFVRHAFVFDGGVLTDLGDLGVHEETSTTALTLKEDGRVLGSSVTVHPNEHAFVWESGVMTDLHDPAQIAGPSSRAWDVNSSGVICGGADFLDDGFDASNAALWIGGAVLDLGNLAPGEIWGSSIATSINDLGQVVGSTKTPSGANRGFLWQAGVMTDLNDLIPAGSGWKIESPSQITNDGVIVGFGKQATQYRPVLLTPNCSGGYTPYAVGCPGAGGVAPTLTGLGCPAPGQPVGLAVADGPPDALGVFAFGLGTGALPLTPGCAASIAPLTSLLVPFAVDGTGAFVAPLFVPPGFLPATVNAQAAFLDPGAPSGLVVSNALGIAVP